jgi:hypothetical protein
MWVNNNWLYESRRIDTVGQRRPVSIQARRAVVYVPDSPFNNIARRNSRENRIAISVRFHGS